MSTILETLPVGTIFRINSGNSRIRHDLHNRLFRVTKNTFKATSYEVVRAAPINPLPFEVEDGWDKGGWPFSFEQLNQGIEIIMRGDDGN